MRREAVLVRLKINGRGAVIMEATLLFFAFGTGLAFAFIYVASFVLHYFVALSARPGRRALWTVGISYALGAALLSSMASSLTDIRSAPEHGYLIVMAGTVPAGLIVFSYWRFVFRRAWVRTPLEGQELASDDWKTGLWLLVVPIIAALPKALSVMLSIH